MTVPTRPLAYLLKGFPRVSETFIYNEIIELEKRGFDIRIYALKKLHEPKIQASVTQIRAPVFYTPHRFRESAAKIVSAHIQLLLDRPVTYARTAALALHRTLRTRKIWTLKRFWQAVYLVHVHLRNQPPAHIHAHFANAPTTVAFFVKMLTRTPYSVSAHAKDIYTHGGPFMLKKLDHATFVTTCTGYNQRFLQHTYRTATPIHKIYHGINLNTFKRGADTRSQHVPTILSVGRLIPKKGFPTMLAALALLRDRGIAFACNIVGDGHLRDAIVSLIDRYDLNQHVQLLGKLTHQELRIHYQQAEVMALACTVTENGDRDGIPNVLVEAMAMGVPVVASDVSGIPELVRHNTTGLLVPSDDAPALAQAIEKLLNEPRLARQLAQSACDHVRRHFDVEKNTDALSDLLAEAIA